MGSQETSAEAVPTHRPRLLAGAVVPSADGCAQLVLPGGVGGEDRVEGLDGGGEVAAAPTEDGHQAALRPRPLLDRMLQLKGAPLHLLVVGGDHQHHLVRRADQPQALLRDDMASDHVAFVVGDLDWAEGEQQRAQDLPDPLLLGVRVAHIHTQPLHRI